MILLQLVARHQKRDDTQQAAGNETRRDAKSYGLDQAQ